MVLLKKKMSYYDTLVLSGGSIKAISILGALQYCYDNKLVDSVSTFMAASAGGLIAYLLIIGYTPTEIIIYLCKHDIFEDVKHMDIAALIHGGGILSFSKFQEHLEQMTIDKIGRLVTLNDLHVLFNKTLVLVTYNVTRQQTEYLSYKTNPELPCLVALRMTSALPMIFQKFKYMDNFYIDGGWVDTFPISYTLENQTLSHRLGIMVDPSDKDSYEEEDGLKYIYYLLTIPMRELIKRNLENTQGIDIIKIKNNINMFDYTLNIIEKMELFSIGYQASKNFFEPEN
jgi:predicted acylesterase/phospholipase RssA